MKKNVFKSLTALTVAAVSLVNVSCDESREGWTVKGSLPTSGESTLYIEVPRGTSWAILDSLTTEQDGSFEYVALKPAASQEIYRLNTGGSYTYFPVEGKDIVTVTPAGKSVKDGFRLSGTPAAAGFSRADSIINDAVRRIGVSAAVNDSTMLADLCDIIVGDTTCVVAYYIATRGIEGRPIFDNSSKFKVRVMGAAANIYAQRRPGDRRAALLKSIYEKGRSLYHTPGQGVLMEATVSGRVPLDLVRKDVDGINHDFNKMADRGGVTILNITCFGNQTSPANLMALNETYQKYKDRGLDIYQISFDANEATWRAAASNLPWTSVYNRPTDSIDLLIKYNADPTSGSISFIFDRNGEVVARVTDPSKLESEVAKII